MLRRFVILAVVLATVVFAPMGIPHLNMQVGLLPAAQSATYPAADLRLACPGGVYQTGGTSGTSLTKIVHSGSAKIYALGVRPKKTKTSKLEILLKHDDTGIAVQDSNWMTGYQLQKIQKDGLSGLAATSCLAASVDSTLLGGSTTTSNETLLAVVNPGKVDSNVRVIAYGPAGRLGGNELTNLRVSAGTAQVVSLNGLIPDAPTFSLRIIADGPGVASFLQQRAVHGTKALGLDWVQASPSSPSRLLAIPGILVRGGTSNPDQQMVLRINNATNRKATLTAQITGEGRSTFGTVLTGDVAPQSTIDLPINGIKDGDFAAQISANENVSASVLLLRTHGTAAPVLDFAWLGAVPAVSSASIVTPASGIAKVSFANLGSSAAQLTVRGSSSSVISVPAGAQVTLQLGQNVNFGFESNRPISATMVIDVDGALSAVPLINQGNLPVSTTVTVR